MDFDRWTRKVLPRMMLMFWRMNEMVFNYEKGVPYGTQCSTINDP